MGGKRPLNLAPIGKLVVIPSCVRSLPLDGVQSSEQNCILWGAPVPILQPVSPRHWLYLSPVGQSPSLEQEQIMYPLLSLSNAMEIKDIIKNTYFCNFTETSPSWNHHWCGKAVWEPQVPKSMRTGQSALVCTGVKGTKQCMIKEGRWTSKCCKNNWPHWVAPSASRVGRFWSALLFTDLCYQGSK